jgi:putative hemolysin
MPGDLFDIDLPPGAPLRRAAFHAARPLLEWVLRLDMFRQLYRQIESRPGESFATAALRALEVEVDADPDELTRLPAQGRPLIVAANHPRGALDGLALLHLIGRVRPDVRLLANHLLAHIPDLRPSCFFVDPFDGPSAAARSLPGLRAAHLWLRHGGAIVVFPAGEVAHDTQPDGSRADSPWKQTVGRMALATGSQVVPAFIDGLNRRRFYVAGRVHPILRTALLARELLAARGGHVAVRLGRVLEAAAPDQSAAEVTARIRRAVGALQPHPATARQPMTRPAETPASAVSVGAGSIPPDTARILEAEIERLPASARLVESAGFQVFCAEASHIPATLQEIGRLREITYRAVGEGTGRERDLDTFDDYYLHLFSWRPDRREVVGAYRIGRTDRILAAQGVAGLYTRTLFTYDERFLARVSPALELGRSFVRAEYQRNHNALLLLWRGIGRFVTDHPEYRTLFGAVSISARYADVTRDLLMRFLEQNHLDRDAAALVQPTHAPVRPHPPEAAGLGTLSVDAANRLVTQGEADGKGMPVLLRQYLKLNARLLGFNVDAGFGDALDALMMVELTTVDQAILKRYFGAKETAEYLARHRAAAAAA